MLMKMFRYSDGVLKNYISLKQETHHFTTHAWLSEDRIIVGNYRGEMFLVQNSDILMEYKLFDHRKDREQ